MKIKSQLRFEGGFKNYCFPLVFDHNVRDAYVFRGKTHGTWEYPSPVIPSDDGQILMPSFVEKQQKTNCRLLYACMLSYSYPMAASQQAPMRGRLTYGQSSLVLTQKHGRGTTLQIKGHP